MFFFFKQKTAYEMRISDWSSDVCSSDLRVDAIAQDDLLARIGVRPGRYEQRGQQRETLRLLLLARIAARKRPGRVGARLQLSQLLAPGADSGPAVAGHDHVFGARPSKPEERGLHVEHVAGGGSQREYVEQ